MIFKVPFQPKTILCCQKQRSSAPAGMHTLEKPDGIWTTHTVCSGKLKGHQSYHEDFLTPHRQAQPELSLPCSCSQQDQSQGCSGRGAEVSLAVLLERNQREEGRQSWACCTGSAVFLSKIFTKGEMKSSFFSRSLNTVGVSANIVRGGTNSGKGQSRILLLFP